MNIKEKIDLIEIILCTMGGGYISGKLAEIEYKKYSAKRAKKLAKRKAFKKHQEKIRLEIEKGQKLKEKERLERKKRVKKLLEENRK
ncbi:hypothetical protein [Clostridium sp.]|uniref:hypothetical protein n=1 Tax=Clostridium sp. TaxID=1506 RepID=UPI0025C27E17|nr:hypothetical protein [Clostridium sp.]MCI9070223.1 hypothetical protein [Clostridium sp.]